MAGRHWQALDDATDERDGKQRLQALVDELDGAGYTAAAKCLADDLDALVVHLRYPTRHRRRWRSTNLLERALAEVKRRTKVIGRFPGETSCLTSVWAVLDLYITHAKNGVRFSQLERQRPRRIRHAGSQPTTNEELSAAETDHHREPGPRRTYSSKETPPIGGPRVRESVRPDANELGDCYNEKTCKRRVFSRAADGIRTHDLLHGKQCVQRRIL
jgi:hypothetical protein